MKVPIGALSFRLVRNLAAEPFDRNVGQHAAAFTSELEPPMGASTPVSIEEEATGVPVCRLCAGALVQCFVLNVLGKYDVRYFKCQVCDSLQTEEPYWLGEAYGHNLSSLDTGVAQRNLQNLGISYAVSRIYDARSAIDIGGGNGLLCRFLRDYGINCFVQDKFAEPTFAQGFTKPDFEKPDLVMAFEVLEHFANPTLELEPLFKLDPRVLLLTTATYVDQGSDWWYLSPEAGQHVFFYSETARQIVADRFGYKHISGGGYSLFVKPEALTASRKFLTKVLLKERFSRLSRSLISFLPTPGVWDDHLLLRDLTRSHSAPSPSMHEVRRA